MPFDVQSTLKDGATEDQILQHLTSTRKFDVQTALRDGATKRQIIDHLSTTQPPSAKTAEAPPQEKTVGGFLANVVGSGGKMLGDMAHAVTHPMQTADAINDVLHAGIEKIQPGKQPHEGPADALIQEYVKRYGSMDALKDTLYEDPGGALADFSVFLGGAGAAVRGTGKVAKVAGAAETASAAEKVAKAATVASEATNPVNLAGKPVKAVARKAVDVATRDTRGLDLSMSDRLLESAFKPSKAAAAKKPLEAAKEFDIGLSASGHTKLKSLLEDRDQRLSDLIDSGKAAGRTIDPEKVAARLKETEDFFAGQVDSAEDLAAIRGVRDRFLEKFTPPAPKASGVLGPDGKPVPAPPRGPLRQIPIGEAQQMKRGTYAVNRKKYGEMKAAAVEAEKALARGLKEEIEIVFPEVKELNRDMGKLLNLEPVLEDALRRTGNWDIGPGLRSSAVGSLAASATGSGAVGAVVGTVSQVLNTPRVKARIGLMLNKVEKQRALKLGKFPKLSSPAQISARIDSYLESLSAQQNAEQGAAKPP